MLSLSQLIDEPLKTRYDLINLINLKANFGIFILTDKQYFPYIITIYL